jgi:hypothetical protein
VSAAPLKFPLRAAFVRGAPMRASPLLTCGAVGTVAPWAVAGAHAGCTRRAGGALAAQCGAAASRPPRRHTAPSPSQLGNPHAPLAPRHCARCRAA